jgi:hypothetical protein
MAREIGLGWVGLSVRIGGLDRRGLDGWDQIYGGDP